MKKENVNRWYLTINQEVSSMIFERPSILLQTSKLMHEYQSAIDARIEEINKFLGMEPCYELSHDFIISLFKSYFCNHIANKAVRMAFEEQETYDIQKSIVNLLTSSQMRAAIYSKPMIDAFSRAIRILSMRMTNDNKPENSLLYSSKILLINEHYISNKKVTNRCGDCGCSCTCDEGCNGDWQKCTSPVNCNHHCACYLTPMIKNLPDKNHTEGYHSKEK